MSLRFRIILLLILVSSIPCIVIKYRVLSDYENNAVTIRSSEVQEQCSILANQMGNTNYMENTLSEMLNAELSQLSNLYDGRIMVIDQDYRVSKDTFGIEEGKTIISADIIRAFKGENFKHYNEDAHYIDILTPIYMNEDGTNVVKGVLLTTISSKTIESVMDSISTKINIWILVFELIILVGGFFLLYKMFRPFEEITTAIDDVTEGYDNENVDVDTYTETKNISESVNKMLNRFRVLDNSRQEFVSNVSHELKTPLTSMKVLADSLVSQENVPVELYQEFMADIAEEIERENKIINDLLSMVKMDKTASAVNIQSENINELVERILKRLRPIAAQKNVDLIFESFRPVIAEVDEVKLSLAVSNLVENAIKYNKEEGWVQVSINADHKYFYIKVSDSGMGIPEESLNHIFERFYRVDKSHSSEISGTGLGLAISRNAILLHRGAIKVHSEEGQGTTFTVRVPLNYIA